MNKRIAKKLRKEMLSWTATSKVRHRLSSFRKAWAIEIEAACRGEQWAQPKHWQEMYREPEPELKLKEEQLLGGAIYLLPRVFEVKKDNAHSRLEKK